MRTASKTIILAIAMALFGWTGVAQAVPVLCPDSANTVTGTSACELGSTNSHSQAQVNADSMFGFTDWVFDAKDNDVDGVDQGANSLGLSLVGDQQSGTWSINANAFSLFSDIMLVFKDGNGVPPVYVGFLLNATSGAYTSPFLNPNTGNRKNISNVALYVRGGGTTVPEPGTLGLLGLAIGAMGFTMRKKKA